MYQAGMSFLVSPGSVYLGYFSSFLPIHGEGGGGVAFNGDPAGSALPPNDNWAIQGCSFLLPSSPSEFKSSSNSCKSV